MNLKKFPRYSLTFGPPRSSRSSGSAPTATARAVTMNTLATMTALIIVFFLYHRNTPAGCANRAEQPFRRDRVQPDGRIPCTDDPAILAPDDQPDVRSGTAERHRRAGVGFHFGGAPSD